MVTQVKQGEKITVEITGLGSSGEGVGKVDGFTVFVPGALPGELVEAKVSVSKKTYAVATLVQLSRQAEQRVQPPCPVFATCGGCQLQHLSYAGQLQSKQEQVKAAFQRIGHFDNPPVCETLGAQNPWHYRNKMLFAVGGSKGQASIGCYAKASHAVVNAPACLIQDQANNTILSIVRAWMDKYGILPYDEQTGLGLVRNVLGRVGTSSGQSMAGLVTKEKAVSFLPQLVKDLQAGLPGLTSVVQIVRQDRGNLVLSGKEYLLSGQARIKDYLHGLSFNISAKSFFQVNSEQTQVLYAQALAAAQLTGKETVIEAYSGTGTIGLLFAQKARQVFGLELAPAAVADARENALVNNCTNIEFVQGDVAQTLPRLLKQGIRPDVFVVDPPRAGLDGQVVRSLLAAGPEKVIYISCNPATLARDVAMLKGAYELVQVQPVDMFPMTAHVEAVAQLVKKLENSNSY